MRGPLGTFDVFCWSSAGAALILKFVISGGGAGRSPFWRLMGLCEWAMVSGSVVTGDCPFPPAGMGLSAPSIKRPPNTLAFLTRIQLNGPCL